MKIATMITMRGLCSDALNFYQEVLDAEIKNVIHFGEVEQLKPVLKEEYFDCIYKAELCIRRKGFEFQLVMCDSPAIVFTSNQVYDEKTGTMIISPFRGKGCSDNVSIEIEDDDQTWINETFYKLSAGGKLNFDLAPKEEYSLYGSFIDQYGICWTFISE